jgi:hypothetical protein
MKRAVDSRIQNGLTRNDAKRTMELIQWSTFVLQEERSKAGQETLVNKAGTLTKLPSVRNHADERLPNEFIVVSPPPNF